MTQQLLSLLSQPYAQLAMAIIVFGSISAVLWRNSALAKFKNSSGVVSDFSPQVKSVSIFLLGVMALVIICQRLFPDFWGVWGWSADFFLTVVLGVIIFITTRNKMKVLSGILVLAIFLLSFISLPEAFLESKKVQETKNLELERQKEIQDSIVMIPINNDIDSLVAQQNQMEKYYGTFDVIVSKDTTVIFIPAYSILNIKIPYGTAIGIMDGNGYHYRYDGFIATPLDGGRASFGDGDMYYRVYYPIKINVTFLVRKKTREEIRIAMPK